MTGPCVSARHFSTNEGSGFAVGCRKFPRRYVVLGTDGFGRSDTREKLRHFFEVDRNWIAITALKALADEGTIPAAKVAEAMKKYGLDPAKPAPWTA